MSDWTLLSYQDLGSGALSVERHELGCTLYHLKCSDTTSYFSLGLPITWQNSRGAPHVLEHMALRESLNYSSAIPYLDADCHSLNVLFNGVTTRYATFFNSGSLVTQDFYNLLEIMWNCVFFPNLTYTNFMYEGVNTTSEPISGVVYNEVAGLYASPSIALYSEVWKQAMYEPYCYDSIGFLPDLELLTFEEVLAVYSRFYRIENLHIFVYGAICTRDVKGFLDQRIANYDKLWGGVESGGIDNFNSQTRLNSAGSVLKSPATGIYFRLGVARTLDEWFFLSARARALGRLLDFRLDFERRSLIGMIGSQRLPDQGLTVLFSGTDNVQEFEPFVNRTKNLLCTSSFHQAVEEDIERLGQEWRTLIEDYPIEFFIDLFPYLMEGQYSFDRFFPERIQRRVERVSQACVPTPEVEYVPVSVRSTQQSIPLPIRTGPTPQMTVTSAPIEAVPLPCLAREQIPRDPFANARDTKTGIWIENRTTASNKIMVQFRVVSSVSIDPRLLCLLLQSSLSSIHSNARARIVDDQVIVSIQQDRQAEDILNEVYSLWHELEKLTPLSYTRRNIMSRIAEAFHQDAADTMISFGLGTLLDTNIEQDYIRLLRRLPSEHEVLEIGIAIDGIVGVHEYSQSPSQTDVDLISLHRNVKRAVSEDSVRYSVRAPRPLQGAVICFDLANVGLRNLAKADIVASLWSSSQPIRNVRLYGGAYGASATIEYGLQCMSLCSSLDPNPESTLEIFGRVVEQSLGVTRAEAHRGRLGSIGTFDQPRTPDTVLFWYGDLWSYTWSAKALAEYRHSLLHVSSKEIAQFSIDVLSKMANIGAYFDQ